MDISLPALVSILALVILVGISCVNEDLNVGFLGIAFGIIVGGIFSNITAAKIMNAFPLSLFMILVGVTFLFGMAQTNGTMEKLTAYSVRACKGNTALVPLIIYILCTFVTTIGPGNIAGCALMAPVSMAIASKVKMPAFLMTLLVVGACNGAAFSPFAPTGIISNGLIAKMAGELGLSPDYLNTLAWKIHFNSELAQGFVNIGGFFVMGGLKWLREQKGAALDIDELAPKPEPFNAAQKTTLLMVAILIILVVVPGLPGMKGVFPKAITNMLSNVGSISFVLSIVLMLTGYGDSKAAVKVMPWSVIMMVCGLPRRSNGVRCRPDHYLLLDSICTGCNLCILQLLWCSNADVPADDSWSGRIDWRRSCFHHFRYRRRFPSGRYLSAFHFGRTVHCFCR